MTRKDIILHAATALFSDKGFKDASMAELCKITGVAEGTIFYHFKSKEELFVAILENLRKEITEEFEKYTEQKTFETGLDMMEGVISFYLFLAGMMEERFLLLHRHDPYQLAEVNAACRAHLEAIYNCFLDIFEKAILRGQEDGSIRKVPARKAALIVFSTVDGLVRLNTYKLYEAGALYGEVIDLCRRMIQGENSHVDG
ncbi:MAG: transcriptional regulator, TetR family [Deltaproteobacteria bacterium]|jgi:AcrR family transcriptional regulator|nr:transcriptional regulator, TetR family [Deltaproteobacteria bacterium]